MSYEVIVSAVSSILVAIVSGLFMRETRRHKKDAERQEARALVREQESLLSLKLTSANVTLALVTAKAIKMGKINGDLDEAAEKAQKAQEEYFDFVNGVFAKTAAKI